MKKVWGILAIISVITLAFCAYFNLKTTSATPQSPVKVVYTPEALVTILNRIRAENGSKPLKLDFRLNQSAQAKADQLAKDGWGANPHIDPSGKHGYEYAQQLVKECNYPSENLLANTTEVKRGFNWWLNSPDHKKAMLSDQWEITGFGVSGGYIVNHFCDVL